MEQPSPPRASFESLPLELKAHIVKLAREQDLAFAQRVGASSEREGKVVAMRNPDWYGRSTNALFMVNKELSALAAVYLFEVSWVGPHVSCEAD